MAKQLRCRDIGMNCDFEALGANEDDVLKQAVAHARSAHQITEMTPELAAKVRAAIRSA